MSDETIMVWRAQPACGGPWLYDDNIVTGGPCVCAHGMLEGRSRKLVFEIAAFLGWEVDAMVLPGGGDRDAG